MNRTDAETQEPEPVRQGIPDADIRGITRCYLDIPYGDVSPAQRLDIYLPETTNGPVPVILSIHGGAFRHGDKRDAQLQPHLLGLKAGYAVVAVNYRLSGEAIFPAGLHDLKTAIRWVRAHAWEYGLDTTRIACWGGSAGGYYSLMLGFTAHEGLFEDLSTGNEEESSAVQAVVDWYGPTDFLQMDRQFAISKKGICDHDDADSPESEFLGECITEVPDMVQHASPITYVHERIPPLFIQHGSEDALVPVQQSELLVEALSRSVPADRYTFQIIAGADHGGAAFDDPANVQQVIRFLDAHLRIQK